MTNISPNNSEKIAVIGLSGRFPGASCIGEFWDNLVNARCSISRFDTVSPHQPAVEGGMVFCRGVLDDIDQFDPAFFKMSPYEAMLMDPQQRIFTEICWEALASGGYGKELSQYKVGVFSSARSNSYYDVVLAQHPQVLSSVHGYQKALISASGFLSTRVAYLLGLSGPSIDVNTACSSSLVAVAQGCQSLLSGSSDMVLAGGVSVHLPQESGYHYEAGGVLSPDGYCRAFSDDANGTALGNAAGVVLLKRLSDAIRDADPIHAVIKGFAVNNDGADKMGYTSPGIFGQTACIQAAIDAAGINPETIHYLEAHGTGTKIGDPIEIAALDKAYSHYTDQKNFCAIGSVKTNIGHTDIAAGIAGFIKALLCLKKGAIPASLHYRAPNSAIKFEQTAFYVNTQYTAWPSDTKIRRAGVSAFGIGGTNAHVILESYSEESDDLPGKVEVPFKRIRCWPGDFDAHISVPKMVDNSICAGAQIYRPVWSLEPNASIEQAQDENILFFRSDQCLSDGLLAEYKKIAKRVFVVDFGSYYQQVSSEHFMLDPIEQPHYQRLFEALNQLNQLPNRIVHTGSFDQSNEKYGFLSLLTLFKASVSSRYVKIDSLTILTNALEKLLPGDCVIPDKAKLIGFCLSFQQESSIPTMLVDLDKDTLDSASACLVNELPNGKNTLVAYRKGFRFTQAFTECYFDHTEFPKGQYYLITGGLSRLGIYLAQHLVKKYQANILLLSRQPKIIEDLVVKEGLEWLQKNAATCKVFYTDVSDKLALSTLFEKIKKEYVQIDGIFHLAATARNQRKVLIQALQESSIELQFKPKLGGAYAIADAIDCTGLSVRFCLLYSSIASVLGGLGFALYAASNNALDHFALLQNQKGACQWISINWDAWRSGLESASTEADGYINKEEALSALFQCIAANDADTSRYLIVNPDFKRRYPIPKVKKVSSISRQVLDKSGIAKVFGECLELSDVPEDADFYDLGGDSLLAIRLHDMLTSELSIDISLGDMSNYTSVNDIFNYIQEQTDSKPKINCLIKLKEPKPGYPTYFFVHPVGGAIFCYLKLAQTLPDGYGLYAIQDPNLFGQNIYFDSLEDMAKYYLAVIQAHQSEGCYHLGGFSFGGNVAFEMAHQLIAQQHSVARIFLIDSWAALSDVMHERGYFEKAFQKYVDELQEKLPDVQGDKQTIMNVLWDRMRLLFTYKHVPLPLCGELFKASTILPEYRSVDEKNNHWSSYFTDGLKTHVIEGDHRTLLEYPGVKTIAERISKVSKQLGEV